MTNSIYRGAGGKWFSGKDFWPGYIEEEPKPEIKLPTQEELRLKGMRMVAAMGGTFQKK